MTTDATGVGAAAHSDTRGRKAVVGAWLAFFVDLFDIYLPIVVLAPAISYFVSPQLGAGDIAVVNGAIFAATLLGRPIGAFVFGHLADTIGRRRTTVIAMTGAGVTTLSMAMLPGYEQWGVAVVVLFIALRLIDGVFLGGEYTAANPLAMESSPKHKRGLYSALITTGFPLAYAAISLVTVLLLTMLPAGDVNSPYVQWGWRLPFVLGAALAFALAVYYSRSLEESELFRTSSRAKSPLRTLFSGDTFKHFLQVFMMVSGFWLSLQPVATILPGVLGGTVGLSPTQVTVTLVVANLVAATTYLPLGAFSQRTGRRPFLIGSGLLMATLAVALYYVLVAATPQGFAGVVALTAAIVVLAFLPWPILIAYINERFHTGVRASAYGVAYSFAVILPSFYFAYQAWLSAIMPLHYTPLVLLAVGALLIAGGAAWGPETRDVDFHSASTGGS